MGLQEEAAVLRSQDLGGFRQEDGQEGFERGPQPLRGKMLTIGRQQGALGDGLVLAFPQVAGNEREQGFRPEVMALQCCSGTDLPEGASLLQTFFHQH